MVGSKPGNPRARSLGAELRQARNEAGITIRELGRRLNMGHAWVGRTERGNRTATPEDVTGIAVALGLSTSERERLVEAARDAHHPNWIHPGTPGIHQELVTLIEYERTASRIVEVSPLLIPGLFQIGDYARAVMAESPPEEIETRVAMRASRRDILTRRGAPEVEAIIMQRAIDEPIADAVTMSDQLRHLEKLVELPNVTMRVLPATMNRWTPAHSGEFMLFDFPKAPPMVHFEHLCSAVFLTDDKAVEKHRQSLGSLRDAAMSPEETKDFIADRASSNEENTS
ncbi:helix-turn-helix domain-containing protein [Actinopolyspora alba]|nr:helix-turn-helix transcriptional regulator [Actinopolyspora alba]